MAKKKKRRRINLNKLGVDLGVLSSVMQQIIQKVNKSDKPPEKRRRRT